MKNNPINSKHRLKLFHLILDLGIGIQSQIDKLLDKHDLTFTQSMFLFQLHKRGKVQAKDLVKCQKTTKGAVSQIISVLEEKELVERERSENDKRKWNIKLTSKAEQIISKINKKRGERMSFIYEDLDQSDIVKVIEVLDSIKDKIDSKYEK
jgi:DNA-binding MarR family transcriptional regulator